MLLALVKLNIFLPSTMSIRAHLIAGFTIPYCISKYFLWNSYFSCNIVCTKYSPNVIMSADRPWTIVQLSLFNHVNPWSISSDIAYTNFTIHEIFTESNLFILDEMPGLLSSNTKTAVNPRIPIISLLYDGHGNNHRHRQASVRKRSASAG